MAVTSYPFDNQSTSESQYSTLFRELQDNGVVGSHGDNAMLVQPSGSGLNLTVQAGVLLVRGHVMQITGTETITLPAASTFPRVDRIVARLDPTANTVSLLALQGTSSGPRALENSATLLFDELLAEVAVAANITTLVPSNVTDRRQRVGGRVGVWSTANRPTSPRKARLGFNDTSKTWEFWTGTAWSSLIPTWGTIAERPNVFPPEAHLHSETYFNKPEVNNLINTRAPIKHLHSHTEDAAALPGQFGNGYVSVGAGSKQDISIRWNGNFFVMRVGTSEFELAFRAQVDSLDTRLKGHGI